MLDREKIVKAFNKANNKRISASDDAVIEGFLDLSVEGVTEEMIMTLIDEGAITSKDLLLDPIYIKSAYATREEPVFNTAPTPAPAPASVTPTGSANPFGAFEQAIVDVVNNNSQPIIENIVDSKFNEWVEANPRKIQKTIEFIIPETGQVLDEVTHEEFETVLQLTRLSPYSGKHPMLVGPAGTGKNHLCRQVADALGLDFYFTNAVLQEHRLTGFIDANGIYHETQWYKACCNGGLFMFDEFDASDEQVTLMFNGALANGYFDFPCGRVDLHPDLRIIACANTMGTGASYEYTGRTQLDMATLDRFAPWVIDYSPKIEESLTDDVDLIDFVREFRTACKESGISHVVSYRAIMACNAYHTVLSCVDSLKAGLLTNLERDDVNMVVNRFKDRTDTWSVAFCKIAETMA